MGFKPANAFTPLLLVLCVLYLFMSAAPAQSGRSWMDGMVFAESDAQGLDKATVELIGDANSERLRKVRLTTTTGENGQYHFKDIPYGGYTFRVSAPGYATYEIELYIASDALTKVHVKLKRQ